MIDFAELERQEKVSPTSWGGFECRHQDQVPTLFTNRTGVKSVVLQCCTCGGYLRAIPKVDAPPLGNLAAFDVAKKNEWDTSLRAHHEWILKAQIQAREEERAAEEDERETRNSDWWTRYNAYLKTPEWKEIRDKVMNRANGICEGCRERQAVQAHHLTYAHVFEEPLFDLVAVCVKCHEKITARDRKNKEQRT